MSTLRVDDRELLAFAERVGAVGSVAVEGSRTRWHVGGPLAEGTRLVRAPVGIVEYRPEEMTVQVRAGTAVAELHAELAARGQRSALPERGGTVGGAVAVGENGLAVLGRGSVRTSVLQVRYVSAEGELVTGGGPVVKNVSGFNLPKLIVGSLGTLGLVAEVVLRTNPLPASGRWLEAQGVDPLAVRDAVLRPSAVLWDGTTTWVHLEGHRGDVDAETRVLERLAAFEAVDGPPPLPPHRWRLVPSEVVDFETRGAGEFVGSIGVGTVWAEQPQPPGRADPAGEAVSQRMKQCFDPTNRLNPGRRPGWAR